MPSRRPGAEADIINVYDAGSAGLRIVAIADAEGQTPDVTQVHIAEFIGSIIIAIMTARLFFVGICRIHSGRLAQGD